MRAGAANRTFSCLMGSSRPSLCYGTLVRRRPTPRPAPRSAEPSRPGAKQFGHPPRVCVCQSAPASDFKKKAARRRPRSAQPVYGSSLRASLRLARVYYRTTAREKDNMDADYYPIEKTGVLKKRGAASKVRREPAHASLMPTFPRAREPARAYPGRTARADGSKPCVEGQVV